VNALILPDNKQSMFVTAVYGVLSLESGEFTYANAGHNPPIWKGGSRKKLQVLPPTGAALGIIDDLLLDERTIVLAPGDFLLLYTDGLTEAFSAEDEIYGEDRLWQVLKASKSSSAHRLLEMIKASVDQFRGPVAAADDLTMLGLRRLSN